MIDPIADLVKRQNDLDARLRMVEGGQRAGLSSIQAAHYGPPSDITNVNNDFDYADAPNTPSVTMVTGSRVLITIGLTLYRVGIFYDVAGVRLRSATVNFGIKIDDDFPGDLPGPDMSSLWSPVVFLIGDDVGGSPNDAGTVYPKVPLTFSVLREDLTPGSHTFKIAAVGNLGDLYGAPTPATFTYAEISRQSITVFPLGVT